MNTEIESKKRLSLLPKEEQLALMTAEGLELGTELLTIESDQATGRYTGERIAKHIERYEAIVVALGDGEGVRSICRRLKVSPSSVKVISEREGETIETHKRKAASNLRLFQSMAAERLVDNVDVIKLESLSIALAIAGTKADELEGEPTQRHEHVHRIEYVDANDAIRSLPGDDAQNVTPDKKDSVAREDSQKAIAPAGSGVDEGPGDSCSPDNDTKVIDDE